MRLHSLAFLVYSGLAFATAAPSFPVLIYSTYLRDSFTPKAIATDISGNIYIAGNAIVDLASGSPQTTVLVVKLNPQATQYLYVRYLGGSVSDQVSAIAVDIAGDAYIAGSTTSPDFPLIGGGIPGTQPPSASSQRSFVAKLDSNGDVVFSDFLGGYAVSAAQAIAITPANQVVVSGMSTTSGFPSTGGSYTVTNTAGHPYLMELDPSGTQTIFSATGIGGSAIALDSSGNIYVAGTTYQLDYPTTPGSYQPTFPAFSYCGGPSCFSANQGANQYVTKVDPKGSKLIYSTAVSGSEQTTNAGLAVDAAGDVYLTGFAGPTYPFTVAVTTPSVPLPFVTLASPFLSKLDPAGQTLLFSVPVGGAGVQVDSKGAVYVGGEVGFSLGTFAVPASLPALANVPAPCLPNVNAQTFGTLQPIQNSAYVAQVDGTSGNVLGTQFIGGSALTLSGVALSGSTLWTAGATSLPDFLFTPNALTLGNFSPAPLAGAYLGAVNFSQPPPAGTPQIACILDAADMAPAGPATRLQLLSIFGTGLGPATGVGAANGSAGQLAGVNVNFGAEVGPLLYVSSSQINLAVPLVPYPQSLTAVQVDVNGVFSTQFALPLTYANPSLFLSGTAPLATVVALNADGSMNSSNNPAHLGSSVSVFVNGLTPDPQINSAPPQIFTNDGWSVMSVSQANPFVLQVKLQVPGSVSDPYSRACFQFPICGAGFTLFDVYSGSVLSGVSLSGSVYINEAQ